MPPRNRCSTDVSKKDQKIRPFLLWDNSRLSTILIELGSLRISNMMTKSRHLLLKARQDLPFHGSLTVIYDLKPLVMAKYIHLCSSLLLNLPCWYIHRIFSVLNWVGNYELSYRYSKQWVVLDIYKRIGLISDTI